MNSCNMFLQSNILYEIFAYLSQLYFFSNPLWTFSIWTLKIYFLIISFYKFYIWILQISESPDHFHDVINWFISDLFYFMNILSMYYQLESFGKIFTTLIIIDFFIYSWTFCLCNFKKYLLEIHFVIIEYSYFFMNNCNSVSTIKR